VTRAQLQSNKSDGGARGESRRLFYAAKGEADAKQAELNSAPIEPHDTLTLHVLPFLIGAGRTLGALRVADLQRGHVQALVEAKAREGHAPDSVKLVFGTIRSLCDAAVGDRLLRVHPIDPVLRRGFRRLWKRTDSEPKPFTVDQMQRFLATAREESSLASLYEVSFLAGLRLGELTGLQLDDLIVTPSGKAKLKVDRQLGQRSSMLNPEPTSPKSGKSRQVDAGGRLCAILSGLLDDRKSLAMAKGWRPIPPWAFVTRNGTPIGQRFVEQDFRRVCEKAKLPEHLTPHSMRHAFACLHIGQCCNPKWLQQQMGHSSINVTLDTYAKWWNLEDHAAADALGALVGSEVAAKTL
jgi:integrase